MNYFLLLNLLRDVYFSVFHYHFCLFFNFLYHVFLSCIFFEIDTCIHVFGAEFWVSLWGIGASEVVGSQFQDCQNSECFCITPSEIFLFLQGKVS